MSIPGYSFGWPTFKDEYLQLHTERMNVVTAYPIVVIRAIHLDDVLTCQIKGQCPITSRVVFPITIRARVTIPDVFARHSRSVSLVVLDFNQDEVKL